MALAKRPINDASHLPHAPGVYLLTHRKTRDTYVGSSSNINNRFRLHLCELRSGINLCRRVQALSHTHGICFDCTVLELTERRDTAAEQRWMDKIAPTLNIERKTK